MLRAYGFDDASDGRTRAPAKAHQVESMKLFILFIFIPIGGCAAMAQDSARTERMLRLHDISPPLSDMVRQRRAGGDTSVRPRPSVRRVTPAMRTGVTPVIVAHAPAPFAALPAGAATPPMPQVTTGGTALNYDAANADDTHHADIGVFAGYAGSAGADACRAGQHGAASIGYDKLADRWIMRHVAWAPTRAASGPHYQCIAVSASSDAGGAYHRYVMEVRGGGQPVVVDDPKMSVWPDAYYFTFVLFDAASGVYRGPQACGIDRIAMLAGADALVRCWDLGPAYGPLLPADLDGTRPPPNGSPNFLMSLDFTEAGSGDHLYLWRVSFTQNTLSGAVWIPVEPFTIACPGSFGGACIGQPAPGEALDAHGDRLTGRLVYRNDRGREVLLANHTVQQPGAGADGPAGVRWYEIREPNGAAGVYQQGLYAPDGISRWIGSIGMDKWGNIALAYNAASTTTPPGIRYTGRLQTDPPGRMAAEEIIINGAGVQVESAGNWGGVSALVVDPIDDCRFWSTQQYIASTGRVAPQTRKTRVASFQFTNCGP